MALLQISNHLKISDTEIDIKAIRAQGAGGQNVNKVSTAIHLRFDIKASSLPDLYKEKLLSLKDRRISNDGCIVIKAQRFRSQEKNRDDAVQRLCELIKTITIVQKKRTATKPTKGSKIKRVDSKTKRGNLKTLRGSVDDSE